MVVLTLVIVVLRIGGGGGVYSFHFMEVGVCGLNVLYALNEVSGESNACGLSVVEAVASQFPGVTSIYVFLTRIARLVSSNCTWAYIFPPSRSWKCTRNCGFVI